MDDEREDERETGGLTAIISIIVLLVIVGVTCLAVVGLYWEAAQARKRTSHEHHVEQRQAKEPRR